MNYFTKSNLQKKVEQQQWVAFSNNQVTIPLFKKYVFAKKKEPIQANTPNNQWQLPCC
jgi:hypothetical protein